VAWPSTVRGAAGVGSLVPAGLLLLLLLLPPGPAWSQAEEPPPPTVTREYFNSLQQRYRDHVRLIEFGGYERIMLMYPLRFQRASGAVVEFVTTFEDPGGLVKPNPDLNTLLIIADEPSLRNMLSILEEVDTPSPQVMIETKVVEITHSDDFQWGINIFLDKGLARNSVTGEISPLVADDSARTFYRGARGLFDPDEFLRAIESDSPYRGGEISFGNVDEDNLGDLGRIDVVIRALEDTGRGEVLSQPSILCTVGSKAAINVGEEVPVPKVSERPNGTFTDIIFKPVGVKLDVTPVIIAEENITLKIEPEVSFVIEFIVLTGGVVSPRISTRNVNTEVSVRDGEAIVIGGLVSTQENSDEIKFPFLGDIPVVGNLFKTYRKRHEKTEVFFFLTPRIVTRESRTPPLYVPGVTGE
jgi:type II secretory pathway component GspD/PulD (secretin)